jgi:hypothetical protein
MLWCKALVLIRHKARPGLVCEQSFGRMGRKTRLLGGPKPVRQGHTVPRSHPCPAQINHPPVFRLPTSSRLLLPRICACPATATSAANHRLVADLSGFRLRPPKVPCCATNRQDCVMFQGDTRPRALREAKMVQWTIFSAKRPGTLAGAVGWGSGGLKPTLRLSSTKTLFA